MDEEELHRAAEAQRDLVARRYFDTDGRLTSMPAKLSRQVVLFDLIAQRFVPGVHYTEVEVNRELMTIWPDYVSLRRGLVDHGMLDRAEGRYWRSGGTVEVLTADDHPADEPADDPGPGR